MIALLQRVTQASVSVELTTIASINQGLLVFLGVEKQDNEHIAKKLVDKVLAYRVFSDENDKMNLNVRQIGGSVLLVPQFTLAADTSGGLRPGFSSAAPPAQGRALFDAVVDIMRQEMTEVETGRFGADMSVALINDGPVTFWLQM